jgi:hypothetical protein
MEHKRHTVGLQAAMEYLITYGWLLIVVMVVIVALFAFGVFRPTSFVQDTCSLPAEFGCTNVALYPNGTLTFGFDQATGSTINVTGVSCTTNVYDLHPFTPIHQISIPTEGNYSFNVQCWSNATAYSSTIGNIYDGYLVINYTSLSSGFPHTAIGPLVQKVT